MPPTQPFNLQQSHWDTCVFTEETTENMRQRLPSRDLRSLTQLGSSPGQWHCLLGAHIVVLARAAQQSLKGPSRKLCVLPLSGTPWALTLQDLVPSLIVGGKGAEETPLL